MKSFTNARKLRLESLEDRALLAVTAGGVEQTVEVVAPTEAVTWVVNTLEDPKSWDTTDDVLSLREAISRASEGDDILFDSSLVDGTITLSGSQLRINVGIKIDASGIGRLTIEAGGERQRVFYVTGGSDDNPVELISLTVKGGSIDDNGGGISNYGSLVLIDCNIIQNSITFGNGGGIYNEGFLSLITCNISENSASSYSQKGGGIFNSASGKLKVFDSIITNNTVSHRQADSNISQSYGGGIYNCGELTLINSSISRNKAAASVSYGKTAYSYGGGIYNSGDMSLTNCLITDNNASATALATNNQNQGVAKAHSYGGGIYCCNDSEFMNCTIAENTVYYSTHSQYVNGYTYSYANSFYSSQNISSLYNTIITGSIQKDSAKLYAYNTISSYSDWESTVNCLVYDANSSLFTDPTSGDYSLAYHSQAIDHGDNSYVLIENDYTGNNRIANGTVDIGAYEYQVETHSTIVTTLDDIVDKYDGLVSLREAIDYAYADDVITFSKSGTISLSSAISVSKNITINGENKVTIDAGGNSRIFDVAGSVRRFDLNDLELTGGYTDGDGGVFNIDSSTSATLVNCSVHGNTADSQGGAFYASGKIYLENCQVYDNAASDGGAMFVQGMWNSGSAVINAMNTVFYNNRATDGFGGLVENMCGQFKLDNCTVVGTNSGNGAIVTWTCTLDSGDAGITYYSAKTEIEDSIIAYNFADDESCADIFQYYGSYSGRASSEEYRIARKESMYDNISCTNSIVGLKGEFFAEAPEFDADGNIVNASTVDLTIRSDSAAARYQIGADPTAYTGEEYTDADLIVTTLDDVVDGSDGVVSLREALIYAELGTFADTPSITFATELAGGTIRLEHGVLAINKSVSIVGNDITIDAQGESRVFLARSYNYQTDLNGLQPTYNSVGECPDHIYDDDRFMIDLSLNGLTVTGGKTGTTYYYNGGGGIWADQNVNLAMNNCKVIGNTFVSHTGQSYEQGGGGLAVTHYSTLQMDYCEVSNNKVYALAYDGGTKLRGGGIFTATNSVAEITRTVISGNALTTPNAESDPTAYGSYSNYGGGVYSNGDLTIYRYCTVSNNIVRGAVAENQGAGVYNCAKNNPRAAADRLWAFRIDNSQITGNQAGDSVVINNATSRGAGVYNTGYGIFIGDLIAENVIDGGSVTGFNIYGAGAYGAGIYNTYVAAVYYCTITNNVSQMVYYNDEDGSLTPAVLKGYGAGIHNTATGFPTFIGCILVDNIGRCSTDTSITSKSDLRHVSGENNSFAVILSLYDMGGVSGSGITYNNSSRHAPSKPLFDEGTYLLCENSQVVDKISTDAEGYVKFYNWDLRNDPYVRIYNEFQDYGCYEYQPEPAPTPTFECEIVDYTGAYDAAAHTVTVKGTQDGDVVYYSADGMNYSTDVISYSATGNRTVFVKVTREGYKDFYGSATVLITPADITGVTVTGIEKVYDGGFYSVAIEGLQEGDTVVYSLDGETYDLTELPSFSNVGNYTTYVKVSRANYNDFYGNADVVITPASIEGVSIADASFVYDGTAKSITVTGAQEGDVVLYSEDGETYAAAVPEYTNVGSYKVYAKVQRANYADWTGCAVLTISDGSFSVTVTGIEKVYDGGFYSVAIEGLQEGDAVVYSLDGVTYDMTELPSFSNVGTYTTYVKVSRENYNDWTGSGTVIINAANIDDVTLDGWEGTYDGEAHSITVNDPQGNTDEIFYSLDGYTFDLTENPSFTEAGNYNVWVKVRRANYNDWVGSETASISKKEITIAGTTVPPKSYDGSTEATVSLGTVSGLIEDDNIWIYGWAEYPSAEPGDYTVTVNYELYGESSSNYIAPSSENLPSSIFEAQSTVVTTFEDIVDNQDCLVSLREAIDYASEGGRITFDPSLAGRTILLNGTQLEITKGITIDASDIGGITIDANGESRVFSVTGGSADHPVELIGLVITGGNAESGGGIYSLSEALYLTKTTVVQNAANYDGGGIYNDKGFLVLLNCLLSDNSAEYDGGGFYNDRGTGTLQNVTVAGNVADHGGGVYNRNSSELVLYNTVIAENVSDGADPNIGNQGKVYAHNTLSSFSDWTNSDQCVVYDPARQLFTSLQSHDYTLVFDSQAVNAGNNGYVTTETDLAGNTRIVDRIVDLGAYEHQGNVPLPTPMILTGSRGYYVSYGSNRHLVTWDAVTGASAYEFEYSTDRGLTWISTETTETSAVVTGLTFGKDITYRVRALGEGLFLSSDWSTEKTFNVCPMDINNDGDISGFDRSILGASWGTEEGDGNYRYYADINGDGDIGGFDRSILSTNWGHETGDGDLLYPRPVSAATDIVFAAYASGDLDVDFDVF